MKAERFAPGGPEAAPARPTPPALAAWLRGVETDSSGKWYSPSQMARAVTAERARAGRTGEAFSLLVFSWVEADEHRAGLRQLRRILDTRLRITDQVGWLNGHHVGVLLPFADADGARSIVNDVMLSYPASCVPLTCDVYHAEGERYQRPHRGPRDGGSGPDALGPRRLNPVHPAQEGRQQPAPAAAAPEEGADRAHASQSIQALFNRPPQWWKRALDIAGATVGLILFAPAMLISMAAIRLVSPGPALFRQQRAGLGGEAFTIYKLRTMVVDAEARKATLMAVNEQDGPAFKLADDPRLIPVLGRLLRSTSLDEVPQLWNVLTGDMSLVGPRPLPVDEAARCESWQKERIDVTPGLTGPWQVNGRSRTTFVQWIRMDLGYVRKRTFLRDVGLLAKTIPAVIRRKGAH